MQGQFNQNIRTNVPTCRSCGSSPIIEKKRCYIAWCNTEICNICKETVSGKDYCAKHGPSWHAVQWAIVGVILVIAYFAFI